jgi:hypothetical protein
MFSYQSDAPIATHHNAQLTSLLHLEDILSYVHHLDNISAPVAILPLSAIGTYHITGMLSNDMPREEQLTKLTEQMTRLLVYSCYQSLKNICTIFEPTLSTLAFVTVKCC